MSATTQYSNYSQFQKCNSKLQQIINFDKSGSIGQVIGSNGTNGLIWVDEGVVNPPASIYNYNFTVEGIPYTIPTVNIDGGYFFINSSNFNLNNTSTEITLIGNININSASITCNNISNNIIYPITVTTMSSSIILTGTFNGDNTLIFNGFFN